MLTTRWQPLGMAWPEMKRLQKEMEQWLRRAGINDPRRSVQGVYPPLNLWEDDDNLYVEAELPELELTDLEIFVDGDNQLSIKGERKQPERENGTWHRQERGHGSFSRVGELPQYVDSDKVTAELKHGVLTIYGKVIPRHNDIKFLHGEYGIGDFHPYVHSRRSDRHREDLCRIKERRRDGRSLRVGE
jgi:HSP20 family protein